MAATKIFSWYQKSRRSCVLVILPIFVILSLFRVIRYWDGSLSTSHLELTQMAAETPPILSRNDIQCHRKDNQSNVCRDVLFEMRHAKWRKCENVSSKQELKQSRVEQQIRIKRGLPVILHRSDLRCGATPFLLSGPGFNFPLPALCDATSSAPCCHHKTGWCGVGSSYCSCDYCTDFRKEISAELYNWTPLTGCTFTNFTSKEACDLMSDRISSLVLIGDSLVRHLFNALMILFTNDLEGGSLQRDLREHERRNCKASMQFVDGGITSCHGKTLARIPRDHKAFCQGDYKFGFYLKEYHDLSLKHVANILDVVRQHLNIKNTVVAVGVGLHLDLNTEDIKTQIIEPILQMKKTSATIWPSILWISTHAHGSLKDAQYNTPSHNDRIARFNQDMEEYLQVRGIPVFDTFNLTRGARSIDGTHFGFGINTMKAQVFMNFIRETF